MHEGNKKILLNTSTLYLRMFVTMVISFYTARVTLNLLGVDNYGLNNLVGGVISMFSFINLSMGTTVQRFFSVEIGKNNELILSKIFSTGLYLHVIIAFITWVIAEIFAWGFIEKLNISPDRMFAAKCVFQISTVSLVLSVLNVPFAALLRAREEFRRIAVVEIIQAFLRLAVLYFLYVIDYDKLIVFSLLNFVVTVYYVFSTVYIARRYKEARICLSSDKKLMKEMLHFTLMLVLAIFAKLFRDQGIVILVNLFFGLAINAAYAIAIQIKQVIDNFTSNFKQSVVPQLMSSYGENNIERMNKLIFSGTKITFFLTLLITCPIILESEYLLNLWLGKAPESSSMYTSLVLLEFIVYSFPYFLVQTIHATSKLRKIQIITSSIYLFNTLCCYLALLIGANCYSVVYISIIISVLLLIISVKCVSDVIQFDVMYFYTNIVCKCVLVSALTFAVSMIPLFILDSSFLRLVFITILSSISLIFGGYCIALNKEERTLYRKVGGYIIGKIRFCK